jgi:putative intracellular protease/amidase
MGNDTWIEDFVAERFNSTDVVASVCTGAMSLAKAGVLNGRSLVCLNLTPVCKSLQSSREKNY